jgi:hypothetical protein
MVGHAFFDARLQVVVSIKRGAGGFKDVTEGNDDAVVDRKRDEATELVPARANVIADRGVVGERTLAR